MLARAFTQYKLSSIDSRFQAHDVMRPGLLSENRANTKIVKTLKTLVQAALQAARARAAWGVNCFII